MKALIMVSMMASTLLFVNFAQARNEVLKLSIADALSREDAKQKLDPGITFSFGTKKKFTVAKSFGEFQSNKKTNAFNKSDKQACEWAFLSAMLTMQERVKKEGGNAMINIKSNYKNNVVDSEELFECGAGNVVAGVTFTGEVVTINGGKAKPTKKTK